MRILADVNVAGRVVLSLRQSGHDVLWARESNRRTADPSLLELATREQRLLVTHDKDFGELIHRERMAAPYGVVLFRIHRRVPSVIRSEFIARTVITWNSWPPGIWTIQIRHSRPV